MILTTIALWDDEEQPGEASNKTGEERAQARLKKTDQIQGQRGQM